MRYKKQYHVIFQVRNGKDNDPWLDYVRIEPGFWNESHLNLVNDWSDGESIKLEKQVKKPFRWRVEWW